MRKKDERPELSGISGHLVIAQFVHYGENVIRLDFTSPILTSGSAVTRYTDKEDGSEYIYSNLSPSNASTAFPMFDQSDLKARFRLTLTVPSDWQSVSNTEVPSELRIEDSNCSINCSHRAPTFDTTKPIGPYLFAFAAGPFSKIAECPSYNGAKGAEAIKCIEISKPPALQRSWSKIYVRKSRAAKLRPQAAEIFKQTSGTDKYFDPESPWPKHDLVLIPDLSSAMIQSAGITFVRESSIIAGK